MRTVWINGSFVEGAGAGVVSAMDAGLLHGVGLFETMSGGVVEGQARVRDVDRHLARLAGSAAALGLGLGDLEVRDLGSVVEACVGRCGAGRARVRLTVTGGDLDFLRRDGGAKGGRDGSGADGEAGARPTVLVTAEASPAYPEGMYEGGVGVRFADARANPLNPMEGHKTLNYWWRLRELALASGVGCAEGLVFSVTNHLVGGCVSNAFVVGEGRLLTPIARGEEEQVGGKGAIPSATLAGVVRGRVLEWAVDAGLEVERRMLTVRDVLEAEEVLLTNSGWGVLPVVRVEKREIGDGKVGEVGRRMMEAVGGVG